MGGKDSQSAAGNLEEVAGGKRGDVNREEEATGEKAGGGGKGFEVGSGGKGGDGNREEEAAGVARSGDRAKGGGGAKGRNRRRGGRWTISAAWVSRGRS
ncbi:unnamed protein product [Linum trigynum]|uniref:Pr1-like protein n=1 Tax=Linum trigynum TaxID=586398 RepID=A0AAV2G123_9ROSI